MADLELQLRLSADGTGLVGTLRSATGEVQRFRTESEKANEVSAASADKVGRAVKAYDLLFNTVGQVVGAFTRMIKAEIDYADQVGTTAQRLGVSTEKLSALGAAAKRNSSDFESIVSGLDSIGQAAVRAGTQGDAGGKQFRAAFAAINVGIRDAAGNLKTGEVLLEDVARGLSALPDGAFKTRLATQLLGSAGKDLTGTLDELAKNGLQGVIDKAHETGEVISTEAAARAKEFKDGLQALNTEVSSFASSVGQAVLPTLLTLAGMFIDTADGAKKVNAEAGLLRTTVENLGLGVVVATETFRVLFTIIYGGIDVLMGVTQAASRAVVGIGFAAAAVQAFQTGQLQAATTFAEQAKSQFGAGWESISSSAQRAWMNITSAGADADARIAEYNARITAGYKGTAAAASGASDAVADSAAAALVAATQAAALAEAQRRYEEALRNGDKAERERAKTALEHEKALFGVAKALSEQRGQLSPLDAAVERYKQRVTEAHRQVAEWAKAGVRGADAQKYLRGEVDLARAALEKETAEISKQTDVLGTYLQEISNDRALVGMTERQRAIAEAVAEVTAKYKEAVAAGHEMKDSLATVQAGASSAAGDLYDYSQAVDQMREREREQLERSREQWGQWADAVYDAARRSGNFLKNLLANVRDIVDQMLREWFRTQIIGLFTGGSGGYASAGGFAGAASGGLIQAGMSYLTGGSSGGGGAGSGSLTSPTTWVNAGRSLYQGFTSGSFFTPGASAGSSIFGSYAGAQSTIAPWSTGASPWSTGTGMGVAPGSYGYTPSPLGYAAAGAAGVYAGYQRYQSSNGGFAGAAGAAAYGVGTYGAAIGVGAAATGGIAAGLAAVPVVGWIALALMAVDMISGGKLFGTSWQTKGSTSRLITSAQGAGAELTLQQEREGALFSGTKHRDKQQAATPEMLEAAAEFQAAIEGAMASAARAIAIDTPPMIDSALEVVNEYTKKGKVKSTKYFVEVLGRRWEEESAELAQTRITAEALVATVAASAVGDAAQTIAERWRDSAETLMDGAQFLVQATADIQRGNGLLGPKGSLTAVADLVDDLQYSGEGVSEAYARIAGSAALLDQALELTGVRLDRTREDVVRFGVSIAEAAGGLQGAAAAWGNLFQNFYGADELASQALEAVQEQVARQLAAIDLDPSTTFEQFRAAFEEALPKLTPEEVVTWLNAAAAMTAARDAQDAYNEVIRQQVAAMLSYIGQVSAMQVELGQGGGFNAGLAEITNWMQQATVSLNAAARAAGRTGASEEDLALIREVAEQRRSQLIRRLMSEAQDIAVTLGYTPAIDTIDSLNAAIAAMGGTAGASASAIGDAVDSIRNELDLLLGDLSPLNDRQKLEAARQGLIEGNVTQEQFLQIARRLFGATSRYREEFEFAQQYPGAVNGGTNIATTGEVAGDGRTLSELISARDALLEAQRGMMASNLASRIAELSYAGQGTFEEVAAQLNFSLEQLGADLGLDSEALQEYLQGLSDQFARADFGAGADLITNAIHDSRDAIVRAIQGAAFVGDPDKLASYDVGTARVNGDQIARIHDGEMILPASIAEIVRSANGNDATVAELVEVRAELRAARELLTEIARQTSRSADASLQTAVATAELVDETIELRRDVGPGGRGRPLSTPLVR